MSDTTTTKIGDIRFRFHHNRPEDPSPTTVFGTTCHLVASDSPTDGHSEILASGFTYLHPGDQFNRALGRKLAARRAIEMFAGKGQEGRAVRKALWETLFKQSPKTRTASV